MIRSRFSLCLRACRQHSIAPCTEGDAVDRAGVPPKIVQLLTRGDCNHANGGILTSECQRSAIGAKGQVTNLVGTDKITRGLELLRGSRIDTEVWVSILVPKAKPTWRISDRKRCSVSRKRRRENSKSLPKQLAHRHSPRLRCRYVGYQAKIGHRH